MTKIGELKTIIPRGSAARSMDNYPWILSCISRFSWLKTAVHEEVETWKEVYGIDEPYKAKCCGSDAKDWLEQVRILRDAHGITPDASLATLQQQTAKAPVANSNFLKQAFLEGCRRASLFEVIKTGGDIP